MLAAHSGTPGHPLKKPFSTCQKVPHASMPRWEDSEFESKRILESVFCSSRFCFFAPSFSAFLSSFFTQSPNSLPTGNVQTSDSEHPAHPASQRIHARARGQDVDSISQENAKTRAPIKMHETMR